MTREATCVKCFVLFERLPFDHDDQPRCDCCLSGVAHRIRIEGSQAAGKGTCWVCRGTRTYTGGYSEDDDFNSGPRGKRQKPLRVKLS